MGGVSSVGAKHDARSAGGSCHLAISLKSKQKLWCYYIVFSGFLLASSDKLKFQIIPQNTQKKKVVIGICMLYAKIQPIKHTIGCIFI